MSSTGLEGQNPDSTRYTMAPLFQSGDSIILTSSATEQLLYAHTLQKRQTLYSLSDFFGLDVFTLYKSNPQLNYEIARIGDEIKVPISGENISIVEKPRTGYIKVFYKVKKQDSPFAVRYRMFNMDKELFYQRNPTATEGLSIDELLFIGYMPILGLEKDTTQSDHTIFSHVQENIQAQYEKYDPIDLTESRGMGYWNPGQKEQTGFYVLFNDAPVNSYIEITNPMYNRTAYARVVSHIPSNMYQRNVLVVVSPMLANYLGVMDSRFFVNLRYLHLDTK